MSNLGYACINETLGGLPGKHAIKVNRGLQLKSFLADKKLIKTSEIIKSNLLDLFQILIWNKKNGIYLYRMSSDMFPWMGKYEIGDLPNAQEIIDLLSTVGNFADTNKIRLTFHPGPFNKLASPDANVSANTLVELLFHTRIMNSMELPLTVKHKINLHIGGIYKSKATTLDRAVEFIKRLPIPVQARLTLENDDTPGHFTVEDLYIVYQLTGTPIVFDYLHHKLNPGNQTEREAFELAYSTWPSPIVPVFHYSESSLDKNNPRAHSDFVKKKINTYNKPVDIIIEAKAKEKAVLKYINKYGGLK